jgi:hypothetical protein
MQVGKGTSFLGGIDDVSLVVGEGVVEEDDGAFGDGHGDYVVAWDLTLSLPGVAP